MIVHLCTIVVLASLIFSSASYLDICNKKCVVCNKDTHRCRECLYGWYGHNCNSECQNCWTSGCHKHSGRCVQCGPGRYGDDCGTPCPDKCKPDRKGDVYCRRENGTCLKGCVNGWQGDTCNRHCSEHCVKESCLQYDGHCTGDCKVGWYGMLCNKRCSSGCLNNTCHMLYGQCIMGCKAGFVGKNCSTKCGGNCLKCHQFTNICEQCPESLYERDCMEECSMNCNGNKCDINGQCVKGCSDGFRGKTCNESCPVNCITCDQDGDTCTKCKLEWFGKQCEQQKTKTPLLRNYRQSHHKKVLFPVGNGGNENGCNGMLHILVYLVLFTFLALPT